MFFINKQNKAKKKSSKIIIKYLIVKLKEKDKTNKNNL